MFSTPKPKPSPASPKAPEHKRPSRIPRAPDAGFARAPFADGHAPACPLLFSEFLARSEPRSTGLSQNRRAPVSLRWPGLGCKRLPAHPFTAMATGFASLNVILLCTASTVTSLLALLLSVSLALFLAWSFDPATELVSSS